MNCLLIGGGYVLLLAGFLAILYAHGERERERGAVEPEPTNASYQHRCPVCGSRSSMAGEYCPGCGVRFERRGP